mmetsp:Transcript_269/g.496  ORF Transcript_269/g.496 Transcript_269/m.496 type:complete len:292 (-) Transcript_269:300-1175(-)
MLGLLWAARPPAPDASSGSVLDRPNLRNVNSDGSVPSAARTSTSTLQDSDSSSHSNTTKGSLLSTSPNSSSSSDESGKLSPSPHAFHHKPNFPSARIHGGGVDGASLGDRYGGLSAGGVSSSRRPRQRPASSRGYMSAPQPTLYASRPPPSPLPVRMPSPPPALGPPERPTLRRWRTRSSTRRCTGGRLGGCTIASQQRGGRGGGVVVVVRLAPCPTRVAAARTTGETPPPHGKTRGHRPGGRTASRGSSSSSSSTSRYRRLARAPSTRACVPPVSPPAPSPPPCGAPRAS